MFKAVFLLGCLVFLHAPSAEGACCGVEFCTTFTECFCKDGSKTSGPLSYCGKGPCNIFGCNCDGGCKTDIPYDTINKGRSLEVERVLPGLDEFKAFKAFDTNGDGLIDMEEATAGVFQFDHKKVKEIDLDRDGKISPQEFDADISEEVMRMI